MQNYYSSLLLQNIQELEEACDAFRNNLNIPQKWKDWQIKYNYSNEQSVQKILDAISYFKKSLIYVNNKN